MTTIVDGDGNRLTNTGAPEGVTDYVYGMGEEYFSTDIDIAGVPYYGYYVPIRDDDGEIVGMSFAGKPKDSVMLSTNYMMQITLMMLTG